MSYSVIRFRFEGERETILTGLTLDEAQEHCRDEATHGPGWFDGYESDGSEDEDEPADEDEDEPAEQLGPDSTDELEGREI